MKRLFLILLFILFLVTSVYAQDEVVYQVDGMDDVMVQNIAYRTVDDTTFTMDVYYPPEMDGSLPAVIFVAGFPDSLLEQETGAGIKDTSFYISWGRLVAASGLVAILYETEQADDLALLVDYIRENAESLQIDGDSLAIFATSGNPPVAISYMMQDARDYIKAAVFYYGIMYSPDEESFANANNACAEIGCYTPDSEYTFGRTNRNRPMFVVRAGRDAPFINDTIDAFMVEAIASNAPITFINYSDGRHGFDISQGAEQSRRIIALTLDFLKLNLLSD